MYLVYLLLLFLAYLVKGFAKTTYENHVVLRLLPETKDEVKALQALDWDWWMEPRKAGLPADVMTTVQELEQVEKKISSLGVKHRVMIKNLQEVINAEAQRQKSAKDVPYFEAYHTYDEVK